MAERHFDNFARLMAMAAMLIFGVRGLPWLVGAIANG